MLTPGRIVWYRPLRKDFIYDPLGPLVGVIVGTSFDDDPRYRLVVFDSLGKTHVRTEVRHVPEMDGNYNLYNFGNDQQEDWFSLPQESFPALNREPVPDGTGLPAIGTDGAMEGG